MHTLIDFNFEKGMNVNEQICFSCQGVIEIIFKSGKYLLIVVMSSKHNTQLVFIGRNILMCLTGNECSFSTKSFWLDRIRICYYYAFFLSFIFNHLNRMKVMCFFLPICTVKLIKFELKLNLIYMCTVIVQSHSVNGIHSLFQSHTIYYIKHVFYDYLRS